MLQEEKTLLLLCLTSCVLVSAGVPFTKEWHSFKLTHGKKYLNLKEETHRHSVFLKNKQLIDEHNEKHARGEKSFTLRLNKYADLEKHERKAMLNGLRATQHDVPRTSLSDVPDYLPSQLDWRFYDCVTEVKDQGNCGSCWAFSVTGALEGTHCRKTGHLTSLSEQNLIDCTFDYGNYGCSGGWMDIAFQYVIDNGGIDTEDSYPYEANNDYCRYQKKYAGTTSHSFTYLPVGNETELLKAVGLHGPISVGIFAGVDSFFFYYSGVYYDDECYGPIDHGVLLVGYGTSKHDEDYWIVKNSWGSDWGEDGYVRIARERDNLCGIANYAGFPSH